MFLDGMVVDMERNKDTVNIQHQLKCFPVYYQAALDGTKPFELRKMDRPYKIGDLLSLNEWDAGAEQYTGRSTVYKITYLLEGGRLGIESGYCVMGLAPMEDEKRVAIHEMLGIVPAYLERGELPGLPDTPKGR